MSAENNNAEMLQETLVSCNTKIDDVKHRSNVTIDWTGMTVRELQELAQRSIVIREQNNNRLKGVVPPKEYSIKAVDFRVGVRAAKQDVDPVKMIEKLSESELSELAERIARKLGK